MEIEEAVIRRGRILIGTWISKRHTGGVLHEYLPCIDDGPVECLG